MKAVIVDLKENHAAALSDDGCVVKVKNKNYAIGQVIELKKTARLSTRFVACAAGAVAAVVMLSAGAWAYYTPYTYVSLDVNPSIEYSVNRFGRVLSAVAVNNDGKKILENLSLQNKPIDEAVKDTVNVIEKDGYFEGTDPGAIEIATASENTQSSDALAQDLETAAKEEIQDTTTPVQVEAVSVGFARVQEARTLNTTPGKLNLVQKLQASSSSPDSINVEDWLKKPVKDIMKAIKQNKKDAKNASSSVESQTSSSVSSEDASTTSEVSEASDTSLASEFSAQSKFAPKKGQGKSKASTAANSGKTSSKNDENSINSENNTSADSVDSHGNKPVEKPEAAQQRAASGKSRSK